MRQETKRTNYNLGWNLSYTGLIIFLLFRIPITNIIGNEGNGFWAISYELYTFFGLFLGYVSFYVTSEMIKACIQKQQYRNSVKVFSSLIFISLFFSVIGALALYLLSDLILHLLHVRLAGISFRLMGVFMVINTLAGTFRGYFEGCGTKVPTCFSNIVEAFAAGVSAIIFSALLGEYGSKVGKLLFQTSYEPAFAAAGVTAGCIVGALFSLLFLIVINRMYQVPLLQLLKKDNSECISSLKTIWIHWGKTSVLMILELMFFYMYRITDMILYLRSNVQESLSINSVSMLGTYYGRVWVVAGIASFVLLSMNGRNIGRIKKNYGRNRLNYCRKYFYDDIKQILVTSVPVCILVFVFAKNILTVLFKSAAVTDINMLRIGSVTVFFMVMGIYLYEILSKLEKKLFKILLPLVSYTVQTGLMGAVVSKENLVSLSLPMAEMCFWAFLMILELLVIINEFRKSSKN